MHFYLCFQVTLDGSNTPGAKQARKVKGRSKVARAKAAASALPPSRTYSSLGGPTLYIYHCVILLSCAMLNSIHSTYLYPVTYTPTSLTSEIQYPTKPYVPQNSSHCTQPSVGLGEAVATPIPLCPPRLLPAPAPRLKWKKTRQHTQSEPGRHFSPFRVRRVIKMAL
jgi:hypothetical protein